jgi:DNA-binding NarL/FixJ family response regulator
VSEPHRILVVDDEPVVRESYRSFFSFSGEFVLSGEARDGAEGIEAYARLRPDLVLMDLQLPVVSGIEATRQICRRWPEACVVAMTTFGTSEYVVAALRAGAAGFLLKDVGGRALLAGLRQALAGDMPLSGPVRRELVSTLVDDHAEAPAPAPAPGSDGVTTRELEVLGGLAGGLSNAQIGSQLFVSEGSVKQHLVAIGRKLGVRSRTGILVRAIQLGYVDPHALPPVQD